MPSSFTVRGSVFDAAGKAQSSASAKYFKSGETTGALSSTTTNASGVWQFSSSSFAALDGGWDGDIEITNPATGGTGRIKFSDRVMTEAVIVREIFLSPDSNDSSDVSRGFFTKVVATADQGEEHAVTFPKLTGAPLIAATAQDSLGAITLSSAETITSSGAITGTKISATSSVAITGGGFAIDDDFVADSNGLLTISSSGGISNAGGSSLASLAVTGGSTFGGTVTSSDINANTLTLTNDLAVAHGGTGLSSFVAEDVLIATDSLTVAGLAIGSSAEVLTVVAGSPAWAAAAASGLLEADMWRLTTNFTGDATPIASNLERVDTDGFGLLGTGMTEASGIFTFPSTGHWAIAYQLKFNTTSAADLDVSMQLQTTLNASSNADWDGAATGRLSGHDANARQEAYAEFLFDVTDVTDRKVRFTVAGAGSSATTAGNTDITQTGFTFIKLAET